MRNDLKHGSCAPSCSVARSGTFWLHWAATRELLAGGWCYWLKLAPPLQVKQSKCALSVWPNWISCSTIHQVWLNIQILSFNPSYDVCNAWLLSFLFPWEKSVTWRQNIQQGCPLVWPACRCFTVDGQCFITHAAHSSPQFLFCLHKYEKCGNYALFMNAEWTPPHAEAHEIPLLALKHSVTLIRRLLWLWSVPTEAR